MPRPTSLSVEMRPGDSLLVDGGVVVIMEHKSGRAARLRISAPDTVRIVHRQSQPDALTPQRQTSQTAPTR